MLKPAPYVRPAILAGVALALALSACSRSPEPPPAPPPAPIAAPADESAPPVLGRSDLLAAIAQAASDHAAGTRPAGTDPLIGRRFAVSLAFGCGAASATPDGAGRDGLAQWVADPSGEDLRLSLTPEDWSGSAAVVRPGEAHWEAVEGFWIDRPWMQGEGCPAISADRLAGPAAGTASPQTVGLAAVFEAGGSRLNQRKGRAYAFTVRPAAGGVVTAPAGGWRLILEGRMAGFPDGRAVRCRSAGPDQRPVCVAAVKLDRVAFAAADGTTVLSEWRTG